MILPKGHHRLEGLIAQSRSMLREATERHVWDQGKKLVAACTLYSGGDDSTVLAHLFRTTVDSTIHVNTGIGIEETRDFVRSTSADWGLPLIEEHGESYRGLVIDQGFPGPAHHYKMYQRLKERGLRKARNRIIDKPRQERVLFLAGRRRQESERRADIPENERVGSIVWVSPLAHWTKADLNAYRRLHPEVPRNPVSANLHMSGECLCGAFAKPGELEQIEFFYPEVAVTIRGLEDEVRAAGHPEERCRWGWGAYRRAPTAAERASLGPLCAQCAIVPKG